MCVCVCVCAALAVSPSDVLASLAKACRFSLASFWNIKPDFLSVLLAIFGMRGRCAWACHFASWYLHWLTHWIICYRQKPFSILTRVWFIMIVERSVVRKTDNSNYYVLCNLEFIYRFQADCICSVPLMLEWNLLLGYTIVVAKYPETIRFLVVFENLVSYMLVIAVTCCMLNH